MTGSGKTTLGEKLAKMLGIQHVSRSYKEFVNSNEELMKFLKDVPDEFVRKFDAEIRREAKSADSVVSSWLGPWLIKESTLNVLLEASFEVRTDRVAKARKITAKEAREYVKDKDLRFIEEVKRVYGINIAEESGRFDLKINTERMSQEEITAIIALASIEKNKKIFG